jgi:hypothetical protein
MSIGCTLFTQIQSNGNKWYGQPPDTIETLIEVLRSEKLGSGFFGKTYYAYHNKWLVMCPITKKDGVYRFFGNFETISHVFNITTTDPAVIDALKKAIVNNEGWKENLHLLKNKTVRIDPCRYFYHNIKTQP